MNGDPHRDLLERATAAIEGIDLTLERQERAFGRMMEGWDDRDARAEERHRQLLERSRADSAIFVAAISDIDRNIQRNNDRLDEMGPWIRANTDAVLAVLDKFDDQAG